MLRSEGRFHLAAIQLSFVSAYLLLGVVRCGYLLADWGLVTRFLAAVHSVKELVECLLTHLIIPGKVSFARATFRRFLPPVRRLIFVSMSLVPVLFGLISSFAKRIPLVLIPGLISGLAYVIPWSVIEVARDEGNNSRFGFLAFSSARLFVDYRPQEIPQKSQFHS